MAKMPPAIMPPTRGEVARLVAVAKSASKNGNLSRFAMSVALKDSKTTFRETSCEFFTSTSTSESVASQIRRFAFCFPPPLPLQLLTLAVAPDLDHRRDDPEHSTTQQNHRGGLMILGYLIVGS